MYFIAFEISNKYKWQSQQRCVFCRTWPDWQQLCVWHVPVQAFSVLITWWLPLPVVSVSLEASEMWVSVRFLYYSALLFLVRCIYFQLCLGWAEKWIIYAQLAVLLWYGIYGPGFPCFGHIYCVLCVCNCGANLCVGWGDRHWCECWDLVLNHLLRFSM